MTSSLFAAPEDDDGKYGCKDLSHISSAFAEKFILGRVDPFARPVRTTRLVRQNTNPYHRRADLVALSYTRGVAISNTIERRAPRAEGLVESIPTCANSLLKIANFH